LSVSGEAPNAEGSSRHQIAQLGYQTMASTVGLVSQEIYSRFGAMLIVHGLLLTVVFLSEENETFIRAVACIAGLLLCPIWLTMVEHGFFYQHLFRRKAANLEEKYFKHVFTVFYSPHTPSKDLTDFAPREAVSKRDFLSHLRIISAKLDIEPYSIAVVAVFFVVYLVMLSWVLSNSGSSVPSAASVPCG
jgi:hypothetical protein